METKFPQSQMVTSIDQSVPGDEYHISLADFDLSAVLNFAKKFDCINLVNDYFDQDKEMYQETCVILNHLRHTRTVSNFAGYENLNFLDPQLDLSKSSKRTLWVFGCSHSFGVGLQNKDQTYGNILANKLECQARIVAKPGSSVQWSLRHLMNANISTQDIVVWQLTTPGRFDVVKDNNLISTAYLNSDSGKSLVNFYNDQQLFFHQACLINQGVRYLRSLNVKFVLTSILGKSQTYYQYLNEYTAYPEYCYTPTFIDTGTDGVHAGPLSHQRLAQDLLDHIQLLDE